MDIQSSYAGTITQAATFTVTIGSVGWTQAAGTFAGGDANITINNIFNLSGGTFTATSAQMLVTSGFNYTAGTFNHNNGLLRFDPNGIMAANSTANIALPGSVQLWNLQYSGGWTGSSAGYTVNITAGSFDVQNQFEMGLTVGGANGGIYAKGGTIYLKGNLVADPQVLGAAPSTWTNLVLDGTGAQTYTSTGGWVSHLEINKVSGTVTPTGGTTSFGSYGFALTSGSFTAPPSTWTVAGDFTIVGGTTYIHNGGSLKFERYSGLVTDFTITLPTALTVNDLTFAGGRGGSASTTNWIIAGATPIINASGNLTIGNSQSGSGLINVNGGAVNVAGNYAANAYSGAGTATLTFNGTGAQSFTKTGAGSTMGGTITIDKSAGTLSLATAASFNTATQDLSVTTGTMNLAGFNLTVNDVLTVGTNGKLICNGGTVTAGSYVINGEVSCGAVIGITWTGLAGDNQWTTAGNWTNNTIPGASDIAVFNGTCVGANCDVTINAAVSVKGINILSSYTGTITQGVGNAVTVGTSGWSQTGGTFTGSSAAATMNGAFSLSGGAYTATSGTTTVNGAVSYTVAGAPTFNHNSGTLVFTSTALVTNTVTPGGVTYNNVTFAGSQLTTNLVGTMTVNGTLTLADVSSASGNINTGTIEAGGDIVASSYGKFGTALIKVSGSGNQTITGVSTAGLPNVEVASTGGVVTYSGTLYFTKNYTYTLGVVDAGTSTLYFKNSSPSLTITPGTAAYNNVTIGGASVTYTLIGTWTVNGMLTFNSTSSGATTILNTGTINANGDISMSAYGVAGSAIIKVSGSANQTITGVATAAIPAFEVASTGGIVTYSGTLFLRKNYTYTSGVVDAGTSTLSFSPNYAALTITPGAVAYNNVTIGGAAGSYALVGSMTVNGTLTMNSTTTTPVTSLNGGTVLAYGDVLMGGTGLIGSSLLKISGAGNQTVSGVSSALISNFEIASTGGIVTYSGTLYFSKNYTYTSGVVDAGVSTLIFSNSGSAVSITPGATLITM
jgi:hypothetical protein